MRVVSQLQRFLSTLIEPLKVAGATDKPCSEILQVVEFLEPFKDKSLAELGDMLRMINEFLRTKQWPEPAIKKTSSRKAAAPKAPKLTVTEAAQRVMRLLERINDPNLEYAAIDMEIQAIDPLTKGDLLKVAQEVGMTIPSRFTKLAILEEIRRRVRDRKGSFDRTQFRTAAYGDASTPGEHSEGSDCEPIVQPRSDLPGATRQNS
jgi:hypothetical protein